MSAAPLPDADAAARERATDPGRSVLVQAPAGSGKTTLLTERMLRLLAIVAEPEEILAVTFTRKAAAEMRARLLRVLQGDAGDGPRAARLKLLAAQVLERSRARGWALERDPARLRILTLDGFNFRLARQLPVTSGGGALLELVDNPQALYEAAARTVLRDGEADPELAADVDLVLERQDNQWSRCEELIAGLLQRRAHWLRFVLADPGELAARVEAGRCNLVRDALLGLRTAWPAELLNSAARLAGVATLAADPGLLGAWQGLAKLLLTGGGDLRKRFSTREAAAFADPAVRETAQGLCAALAPHEEAVRRLGEAASLPGTLDASELEALGALSRVLRRAAACLHQDFARARQIDHTWVAGAARAALTEEGLPSDLALQTGLQLRHLLVDEFQDTSLGQFELLAALTATWEPGDGRSLFLVGDPMQSIYGFREAEVGLFVRAREHGLGAVRLESVALTRNFRSTATLIDWHNTYLSRLFPGRDDVRTAAIAFSPSEAGRSTHPPATGVTLQLFPAGGAAEAHWIAARIAGLRVLQPACSVAVLVAARTQARPVIAALEAAGIPALGVDLVPLAEVPVVRDLVALATALHDPLERTAWLTVLRAPFCGLRLRELTVLGEALPGAPPATFRAALGDAATLARCDPHELPRLERVRAVLEEAAGARCTQPPAEWLERTWLRLGGADACAPGDLADARALLDALAERAATGSWRTPADFPALLRELHARPAVSGNPVEIMTIHKAKGLEFDHVFVPRLEAKPASDREPLLRWLDLPRDSGGSDLLIAPIGTAGEGRSALGESIRRLESERRAHEQIRLLYVAATRARHSLHLSASPARDAAGAPRLQAGSLLRRMWSELQQEFRDGGFEPAAAAATANVGPVTPPLERLRADWRAAQLPPDVARRGLPVGQHTLAPEFSWVGETARHVGTVVHASLERLARRAPDQGLDAALGLELARAAAALLQLGVPPAELAPAAERVQRALEATVEDARGRWILDPGHEQAGSEIALTGLVGGRIVNAVIDRSFVHQGVRWVIDFKTSRHEGGDREAFVMRELERYGAQLARYGELARSLGPQPVRAALYFPLLAAFREWPGS